MPVKEIKTTTQNVKFYLLVILWSQKQVPKKVIQLIADVKKVNLLIVFITQSLFKVSKDVLLNSENFIIWEFQITGILRLHTIIT